MCSTVSEGSVHLWNNYLVWKVFYCHCTVIQGLKLVVLGVIQMFGLFQTWRISSVSCGLKSCITRSFFMTVMCSVGTTLFNEKESEQKSTFFLPSGSLSKQKPSFFSISCLGVLLKSFIQVGGEMGKEGVVIFFWNGCGIAALLAGLLDALVFFCQMPGDPRQIHLCVSNQLDVHLPCRDISHLLWSQWGVCSRAHTQAP